MDASTAAPRRSAQDFLELVERGKRGRLKLYIGFAAGVGKTFRMLIEGHGRVSLVCDDDGLVTDAQFNVIEFRGFEKMLQGRMIWEMPLMTSRSLALLSNFCVQSTGPPSTNSNI